MIKDNFYVFMKRMFWYFSIQISSIRYLKVLQLGSVEIDSVYIIILFSKTVYIYIYIYIELNYTLNKLVLGTAVSAFITRPQPRFYSIKSKL